jgi:2-dehydropantoate 2-reductase
VVRGAGSLETDYLNGEVVLLGRLHGVATPANATCQALGWQLIRDRLPAGHFRGAEVLDRVRAAAASAEAHP